MKEDCLSKNPLVRDGTSQPGRVLKTLLPSYVSVDERSMKDMIDFVQQFSKEIVFYNNINTNGGDWEDFFKLTNEDWSQFSLEDYLKKLESLQETKPHWALFFAFLYLFKIAQTDLNTITKRHLDFYYRDVLQLEENPAEADQVTIIFKLAKHISQHLIKKGTLLKAGKDANGVERFYKVEKDTVINKAQVIELKSVFANINNNLPTDSPDSNLDHRIFASPIANSADGIGGDLENEQKDWRTFGQPTFSGNESDRIEGEIGFAIASPQLFLAEGERKVTLALNDPNVNILSLLSATDLKVFLSGEEEWIEATNIALSTFSTTINSVSVSLPAIEITIAPDQPAIVAYNEENLTAAFQTKYPVAKVVLNNGALNTDFSYEDLKSIQPETVTIHVDVKNVRQLILQNDQAVLDPSKPFQPFTNRPFIGSNFHVGSWEVFQKKITQLDLNIVWSELPEDANGFKEHYAHYNDGTNDFRNNSYFQIQTEFLEAKDWKSINSSRSLFTDNLGNAIPDNTTLPSVGTESKISYNGTAFSNYDRAIALEKEVKFNNQSKRGFLRLTLIGKDFGHSTYPNAYANQAITLASTPNTPLPKAPYTPSIQELFINYTSEETIKLNDPLIDFENRIDQFFHIESFGVKEINTTNTSNSLLPQFQNEGNLYIGLENLLPPQNLSLHFQVAEGSANPDRNKQNPNWSFLSNNEWIAFQPKQILSDSTNGLLTSGIIEFDIPKTITNQNTLLTKNLFWIQAQVAKDSDAICRLIEIKTQALIAKFSDNNNDLTHLADSLEAGTIGKLYRSDSAVDKVEQPYNSFGGKLRESNTSFYTRVSERLRHKRRAITMWDYERLILQEFPEVYKVKAINHTKFTGTKTDYSEIKPGHVTLIIISNVKNKNAVDPLRPKTSLILLDKIEKFIKKICPPCISIYVKNPLYESVKVKFEVKFHAGVDSGFFLKKLNEELKFFLSPWASDCGRDIVFGGKIHKSMVLNFVEERSYVDYVSCFKMFHIVPNDINNKPNKDVDEIAATTAVSILGSADEHEIEEITTEECSCPDNEIKSKNRLLELGNTTC